MLLVSNRTLPEYSEKATIEARQHSIFKSKNPIVIDIIYENRIAVGLYLSLDEGEQLIKQIQKLQKLSSQK